MTTAINLKILSQKHLQGLPKELAKVIATFEVRTKTEARTKTEVCANSEERAKSLGFTLAELIGATATKAIRAPATAKYRHPETPSLIWSGRGRQPLWFVAFAYSGKDPKDLALCGEPSPPFISFLGDHFAEEWMHSR